MSATLPTLARASAWSLNPQAARALRIWAVGLGIGVCLLATQISPLVFAWTSGTAFAAMVVYPFAARRGIDTADIRVFFLFYFAFAMLLRGIGLLTFVDSPYLRELGDPHSGYLQRLVGWVFFWCAAGLVAMEVGYGSALATRWANAWLQRVPSLAAAWEPKRILRVAGLLLLIGGAGAVLRIKLMGGLAGTAGDLVGSGTQNALGRWWLLALTEFAVVGFHVWAIGEFLQRPRGAMGRVALVGLAFMVPLYLVTSSKFLIIRVLFLPVLWRHLIVKKVPMVALLLCFVGFGLLFPVFYAYRSLGLFGLDAMRSYLETTDAPLLKVYNRAYDADSFVLVLHRSGIDAPLLWGKTLVDVLVFWIPRAFWAAKPASFGLVFANVYMPDFRFDVMTYMSPSLPGELWANFAWPGVLAGFWLLGVVMRASREAVQRGGPAMLLMYGFLFLTFVHVVEGSIAAQLENFISALVPTLIAAALLAAPRPPDSGQARVGASR